MATILKLDSIIAALNSLKDDEIDILISEATKLAAERKEKARLEIESKIKELAYAAGISLTDLAARLEKKSKPQVAFRHPENKKLVWTGLGRKPTWVKEFLAAGGDLESCHVK